jgi:hypothetical protein
MAPSSAATSRGRRARDPRHVEDHAVPGLDRETAKVAAGVVGEVGRADQLAAEVVRPAVQRADDVRSVLPRPRSITAWRWRQTLDTRRSPAGVFRRRGPRSRAAGRSSRRLRHGERMADVARAAREQAVDLALVEPRVEVAADGKGRLGRGRALPGVTRRSDMAGRASWVALAQRGPGVDGSAAGKAEGPRIVPSPRAQPVCPAPATVARPASDRAFEGHVGPGRLTTIVVFLQTE